MEVECLTMISALFFSVAFAAVSAGSVNVSEVALPKSVGVVVSKKQVLAIPSVFGPVDERSVTKDIFERAIKKFSCDSFTPKYISNKKEIQKSDIAREIFEILKSKNGAFPVETATIRFRDMETKDASFPAAQAMVALGIMPAEDGNFQDRAVKSFELERMLARAFQAGCGLIPNDDPDNDKVLGDNDQCPLVPGGSDGCPEMSFRPRKETSGDLLRPYLRVPVSAESDGFLFHEQTDIQEGDLFRAVIRSLKTGENLSESAPIEVQ